MQVTPSVRVQVPDDDPMHPQCTTKARQREMLREESQQDDWLEPPVTS